MEPKTNFEYLIAQLSLRVRLFRDAKNPVELPIGISERELTFLEYLDLVGGRSDTSAMGKFFQKISPSTISSNIEKLYSKNLVTRDESPIDRRIKLVSVTSQGLELLKRICEERHDKIYRHIVSALMIEKHEMPILSKLILNAIKNLNSVMQLADDGAVNPQSQGAPTKKG